MTTYTQLGFFYFPNWTMAAILFPTIPLIDIFSVEINIIISSRMNDIRAAQQLGALTVIPFGTVYVAFEANLIAFDMTTLLFICAIVCGADFILFYFTRAIFRREDILTKWR